MAYPVKVLATRPDDLNPVPRTHMVERETSSYRLSSDHTFSMAHANLQNKYTFKIFLKFFPSLVRLGSR